MEEAVAVPIPCPVMAELEQRGARLDGMIAPGQSTTAKGRTVFFIDDTGVCCPIR
ncbi:MAG: hypothetical protein M0Z53_06365 [Thermaerobacter sp.]|nr:hypothetical protein [Thermaerobacter sp.]